MRSLSLVVVVLTVVVAGLSLTAGVGKLAGADATRAADQGAPAAKAPGAKPAEPPGDTAPPDDTLALLEAFAQVQPPAKATRAARVSAIHQALTSLQYRRLRFLVASLPDPRDSKWALLFDSYLAAIQVALGRSRFTAADHFDPWAEASATKDFRRRPAALLFRRPSPSNETDLELLVLLVVGETPTEGVHPAQLGAALDAAFDLRLPGDSAAMQLLGPSSSSSAESLRAGILGFYRRHPKAQPRLEIISGTATAMGNAKTLGSGLASALDRQLGRRAQDDPLVTFATSINPDPPLQRFVENFVKRAGATKLAILHESSTTYGEEFAQAAAAIGVKSGGAGDVDPALEKERGTKVGGGAARTAPQQGLQRVSIPFPLYISRARGANPPPASDTPTARSPGRSVPLKQDDPATARDAFATYSKTTEATIDQALRLALRSIATQGIKYVEIIASDARDTLFLVDRVREQFPNVVIIVASTDLLFLHPEHMFMDGVLVASTYPLNPWNQRWSFPYDGGHLVFASEYAQGLYNAALLALDTDTSAEFLEYSAPFEVPDRRIGKETKPGLWMTVISNGQFWPVWSTRTSDQIDAPQVLAAVLTPSTYDWRPIWLLSLAPSSEVLLFIVDLLCLTLCWAYARAQLRREPAAQAGFGIYARMVELFRPPERTQGYVTHALFAAMAFFVLAIALVSAGLISETAALLASRVGKRASSLREHWPTLRRSVEWVAFVATVAAALHGTSRAAIGGVSPERRRWFSRESPVTFWAFFVGAVVATALATAYLRSGWLEWLAVQKVGEVPPQPLTDNGLTLMYFLERARHLYSGVSIFPALLLLCAAAEVWVIGYLRRVRLREDAGALRTWDLLPSVRDVRRAEADESAGGAASMLTRLGLSGHALDAIGDCERDWPSGRLALVMVVCGVTVLFLGWDLPRLEWDCLSKTLITLYALLTAALVFGCCRFYATWIDLKRLMDQAAVTPGTAGLFRMQQGLMEALRFPWRNRVEQVWLEHVRRLGDLIGAPALPASPADAEVRALVTEIDAHFETQAMGASGDLPVPALTFDQAVSTRAMGTLALMRDFSTTAERVRLRLWEDFVALRLVALLGFVRAHLFNLIGATSAAVVPLLFAMSVYPLKGNRYLLLAVLLLAGAVIAATGAVFIAMNRDGILSHIAGSTPGRITWDASFINNLVVHVVIPLIALVAVKFPEISHFLRQAVLPMADAFGH